MFDSVLNDLGTLYYNSQADNPAKSAMPYYNQIPDMLKGIFNPFIQAGQNAVTPYLNNGQWAGNNLQTQIQSLTDNPTGIMNQIGSTFKQSPGYNWQTQQAQQAVNNAATAGGMAGSPLQQQNSANVVNQLANQDYYNYLSHGIGMYNQGFGGLQHMYGIGAQTANNMYDVAGNLAGQYGSDMASALMNQGNLSAYSTNFKNNRLGSNIAALSGLGSSVLNGFGPDMSSMMGSMGGGGGGGGGGGMGGGMGGMFGSSSGGGGTSGGGEAGQLPMPFSDGSSGSGGGGSGGGSDMMSTIMKLAPLAMMFL